MSLSIEQARALLDKEFQKTLSDQEIETAIKACEKAARLLLDKLEEDKRLNQRK